MKLLGLMKIKCTPLTESVLPHLIGGVFLAIAIFLAYANSLHGIWAFDDVLINHPLGTEGLLEKMGWRKMAFLSFYINQQIDPYSPVNFRLFNLLIHILNSILVYTLTLVTLRLPDIREKFGKCTFPAALFSAALFALHPLNINAVAYIIQRMASLAAFFVLLSLLSYIAATAARSRISKVIFYGFTLAFIFLGIMSKENAVLALPLILLYDYFFLSRRNKRTFKIRAITLAAIGLCALVLSNFYLSIGRTALDIGKVFLEMNKPLSYQAWMATDVYWSPLQHILTEFRVVSRYLFLFAVPLPGFFVFDWWGYPVSKNLFEPAMTIFSALLIVSAIVFSLIKGKKYPFLAFGILWYFIAISLESFIAVGTDLYFEHRNYLPLAGLSLGLVTHVASFVSNKKPGTNYALWIVFLVLSVLLGAATYQRNLIWKDPVTFWQADVHSVPDNPRAHFALANSYFLKSDFLNAETYYNNTIRIADEKKTPHFMSEALYRLGLMKVFLEQSSESKKIIEILEKVSPNSYRLKILEGSYRYLNNDFQDAINIYLQIVDSQEIGVMDKVTVYALLGDAYRAVGRTEEALTNYEKALNSNHSFPAALHGIAKVKMMKMDMDSSSEYLRKVLSIDPDNIGALTDMANLILIKGEGARKALPYVKRAVSLDPPFNKPYLIMGTVLMASGENENAENYFMRAKKFNAPDYLILFNKAWAYSLRGDREKQIYCLRELLKEKDMPQYIKNSALTILSRMNGQ
jgi:protein O-mannosyl-transferase